MIKNDDLRTSPKQRLIIIIIAAFMLISTFALYAGIILSYGGNTDSTSKLTAEEQSRYDKLLAEYNKKVEDQANELSGKYFNQFKGYKNKVKSFNSASVDNLRTEDLKVGTGKKVSDENFVDYSAYYIGWLSDETVFDSSFDDFSNPTKLKSPLAGSESLIEGWKRGIVGMKIGGVRLVTIPSALGYGDTEQGNIPANSPLKFVIMLIDKVDQIETGDELLNLYYKSIGMDVNAADSNDNSEESDNSEAKETEESK